MHKGKSGDKYEGKEIYKITNNRSAGNNSADSFSSVHHSTGMYKRHRCRLWMDKAKKWGIIPQRSGHERK